ncbi:hypothetical protein F2Q68_00046278 [Brassica cretica]|uniref:MADS-box domain-containing protein n=1 Tax=Brassica cretica TaxID=69181 RepID=A0A8S9LIV6_BRACR|nr:hypothetical protein F2Q68_00046278 [Brassica cretica]
MVRGKIQLKRIENPVHRQVTFCKRRTGLLKKAKELSVLCDAEIGVVIFSPQGKLFELATKGTMEGVVDKYLKCTGGHRGSSSATFTSQEQFQPPNLMEIMLQEIQSLRNKEGVLENANKYLLDKIEENNNSILDANFATVETNYSYIPLAMPRVLKNTNKYLLDKIEENNNSILDANFAIVETNYSYPLAMPSEIFQF